MPRVPSPTMRRRRLGDELRKLREAANVRAEIAAAELDCSLAKIRHIEGGRNAPKKPELIALAKLYGVDDDVYAALEGIRQEAAKPGWWSTARLPPSLQTYVGAESDADVVQNFALELIPGLLQVEEYARDVHVLQDAADIDKKIDVRIRRQQRLVADEDPLALNAVFSEAALRRLVNASYAKAQLRHLLAMAERPNITIQILPFSAGLHASMNGGFVLLKFDPAVSMPAAYLEYVAGGDFVDDQAVVSRIAERFATLRELAMSEEESVHFIREWI